MDGGSVYIRWWDIIRSSPTRWKTTVHQSNSEKVAKLNKREGKYGYRKNGIQYNFFSVSIDYFAK